MVHINLLRSQQSNDHPVRRRATAELIAGICVMAGVCAFWGWVAIDVTQATQRLERQMQAKQARVELLQKAQREVLALEERRQAMVMEQERAKALTSELDRPIRLLSIIGRVVDPLDVWLRHLQAKGAKVVLSGSARSLHDVLELAKAIDKNEGLGPVEIVDAGPHVQLPDLFQFSMNVLMDSPNHGGTNS